MLVSLCLGNEDGYLINAIATFYFRTRFQTERRVCIPSWKDSSQGSLAASMDSNPIVWLPCAPVHPSMNSEGPNLLIPVALVNKDVTADHTLKKITCMYQHQKILVSFQF